MYAVWPRHGTARVRGALPRRAGCDRQTLVTAVTQSRRSKLLLRVWFQAMWWLTNHKQRKGAQRLQRVLVLDSYRIAWTWLHKWSRIRRTASCGKSRVHGRVRAS